MPTLTVCMIVKNEENCIERSLQSIQNLADEIVIVDTDSTDGTLAICRRFTDKIFHFSWNNDFSAARNFALSHATSDWILFLDADEVIAQEDQQNIKKIMADSSSEKSAAAYFLHQKEYTNDSTLTGFQYCTEKDAYTKAFLGFVVVENAIRLFRRDKDISFSWRIHESVAPSLEQRGIVPLDSGIFIHHYKQEKGKEAQHQKMLRYLAIGEQQLTETPHLAKPHYEVGLIYYALGRYADAITAFQKVISLKPDEYRAYYKLGRCFAKIGRFIDSQNAFEKYLTFDSQNSDVYGELGLLAIMQGNALDAERLLRKAVALHSSNILGRHNLSLLLLQLGRKEEGIAFLQETAQSFPNPFAYNTLGILSAGEKDYTLACGYFEKGIACSGQASAITKSLYMNLIQTFIIIKDRKNAEQCLSRFKVLFPGLGDGFEKDIVSL